jgi:putative membrane protein
MSLLFSWLILSAAVWFTAMILPGFHVRSPASALVVAAVFGVLNFFLGWILFGLLGLMTLGLGFLLAFLTRLVVNAILLKLTDAMTDHLTIDSFKWALGGALLMSVLGTLGEGLVRTFL